MGQGSNFACIDCKVIYYMGYGGEKFLRDKEASFPAMTKEAHKEHEVRNMYGMDYNLVVGEDLYFDNPFFSREEVMADGPEIVGYKSFRHVNFSGESYPNWGPPFEDVGGGFFKCLGCLTCSVNVYESLNDAKCWKCGLEKR